MLDHYLQLIKVHLVNTHSSILDSFNLEQEVKEYRPIDGGWTILEILEHVALTSHFLLILIDKGASKALRNVNKLSLTRSMEDFHFDLSAIEAIGIHKSFDWIRPEHMEPTGTKSESEVIKIMRKSLKPSSFRLWRKRVAKKNLKHRKKFEQSRKILRSKISKNQFLL